MKRLYFGVFGVGLAIDIGIDISIAVSVAGAIAGDLHGLKSMVTGSVEPLALLAFGIGICCVVT